MKVMCPTALVASLHPGTPIEEYEWGYDRGKEFYRGVQRGTLRPPGQEPFVDETRVEYAFDGEKLFVRRTSASGSDSGAIRPLEPSTFNVRCTPRAFMGAIAHQNGRSLLGETFAQAKSVTVQN
jgi:hypothetical protein